MSETTIEEVPMALEVNCATGEQTMRPLTAEAEAARLAEQEAKAVAKAAAVAKLTALGLTEEEALAIVGG